MAKKKFFRKKKVGLAANMKKAVDKEIKRVSFREIESKKLEIPNASISILNGTPNMAPLSFAAVGNDNSTITGSEIMPQFVNINLSVQPHNLDSSSVYRIVLFQDRNFYGTSPAQLELMQTSSVHSQYDWENRKRFKILYDRRFANVTPSPAIGGTTYIVRPQVINIRKKLSGKIYYQQGANGTGATCLKNQIFMYLTTSEPTNATVIAYSSRLTFKDG